MKLLSKLTAIHKKKVLKRESDAASRQMQEMARQHIDSRLAALEARFRNEARQK